MGNNTKLLIIFCFLIIIAGFSLVWFGLKPQQLTDQSIDGSPKPTVVSSNSVIQKRQLIDPGSATESAVAGIEGEKALVSRVVDGDTIEIEGNVPVRLIGIDTPETVDPRRPVGCFGKEASNETKKLLTGKVVILQKDVSETDKYHRLLRYIFLPLDDGSFLFVNDYLVREGFAKILTYPPDVKYNEQFLEAEQQAREANKGLWGRC